MVAIIISVIGSVISGMVLFFMQRYFKRKAKKDDARDEAKERENYLILKSISAIGKLTYANAIAIRDGKTNGEMHEAMEAYEEVSADMYEYLLKQSAKK